MEIHWIKRWGALLAALLLMVGAALAAEGPATPTDLEPVWEILGDRLVAYRGTEAKVTIPDGVREIGAGAFRGLMTLEEVTLPDSVEEIGAGAFADCQHLRRVRVGEKSRLARIGSQAFLRCAELDTGFVPTGVEVAGNSFEGVPQAATPTPEASPTPTPVPSATPTAEVTPTPTVTLPGETGTEAPGSETPPPVITGTPEVSPTPTPTPTQTPKPTRTPKPTKTPRPTPTHPPVVTDTPAPEETEEPEEPDPFYPGGYGSGGGHNSPHARNTVPLGPDYGQVDVSGLEEEEAPLMEQLTLGDEPLALTLLLASGEKGSFTAHLMTWEEGTDSGKQKETGEAETEPEEVPQATAEPDTLILTAANGEEASALWQLNGSVLLRLSRSGIRHLALCSGEQVEALETDGLLAGWAYDALKTRGIASRRFDFDIEMTGEGPAAWVVRVEEETYTLSEDPHAPIYLQGARSTEAAALDEPWEALWPQEDSPREGEHKSGI